MVSLRGKSPRNTIKTTTKKKRSFFFVFSLLVLVLISVRLIYHSSSIGGQDKNDGDAAAPNDSSQWWRGRSENLRGIIITTAMMIDDDDNDDSSQWWRGRFETLQEKELPEDFYSNATHWIDPNFGARHPNGSLGMIVDPSPERIVSPLPKEEHVWEMLKRSSSSSSRSRSAVGNDDDATATIFDTVVDRDVVCPGGDGESVGVEGVFGHVPFSRLRSGTGASILFGNNNNNNKNATNTKPSKKRKSRVLCLVYTAYFPNDQHSNLRAQAHTWGRRCDGFIAASNFTDHSVGAIDLPHVGLEEYGNMWQKIRSMWAYAYHHYLNDYDWFYICGDDVYMAVDNLRTYLDGPEIHAQEEGQLDAISSWPGNKKIKNRTDTMRPRPLILGTPMMFNELAFPCGAGGYTLNRAALKLFGDEGLTTFMKDNRDAREDVFMGSWGRKRGVFVSDSRDPHNATRYGRSLNAAAQFERSQIAPEKQKRIFGIEYARFEDSVSSQQISFHLKNDLGLLRSRNRTIKDSMYRYHTFLYNLTRILCN